MPATKAMIRGLDDERRRQGLSSAELARLSGLPESSIRRLFSSKKVSDVKVSTVAKIATVVGAELALKKIDDDLPPEVGRLVVERVKRRRLAERLAARGGHDPGDVEHALYNLTLAPSERLARRFRGRHVLDRR